MELNAQELALLSEIRSGRARRVDHITDTRSLETLKRNGLVFVKPGRPTVPRSSADFSRSIRRHGTVTMIEHDEAHLTTAGQREYSLHFYRSGKLRQRDDKLLNALVGRAKAEPDNVLIVSDKYFEEVFGVSRFENEFRPTVDKWARANDLLYSVSKRGDEFYLIKRQPNGFEKLIEKRNERNENASSSN